MERIIKKSALRIRYESLKEKQVEAISMFLQGHDNFAVLPTGYGKSVIYTVFSHAFDATRGNLLVSYIAMFLVDKATLNIY